MLTACQVRMARAALGLSLHQLAALSGVSEKTIRRCEAAVGIPPIARDTSDRLRKTFEEHGCTFELNEEEGWARVTVGRGAEHLVRQNLDGGDGGNVND